MKYLRRALLVVAFVVWMAVWLRIFGFSFTADALLYRLETRSPIAIMAMVAVFVASLPVVCIVVGWKLLKRGPQESP